MEGCQQSDSDDFCDHHCGSVTGDVMLWWLFVSEADGKHGLELERSGDRATATDDGTLNTEDAGEEGRGGEQVREKVIQSSVDFASTIFYFSFIFTTYS